MPNQDTNQDDKNLNQDQDTKPTHEFDAEIFSVGKWNGDQYTQADLEDMVKNFNLLKDEIKPTLKLGHDKSKLNDNQPALGWVKALKLNGSKIIATFAQVPDVVYRAIKAGRYKRVSSEIYWNYRKSDRIHKRVLSAVALLGATPPAVTNLADLEAYLSQSIHLGSFDECKAYSLDVSESGEIINSKGATKMEDVKIYTDRIADLESQLAENVDKVAKLSDLEKQNKTYAERLANIEAEKLEQAKTSNLTSLKEFCEAKVKDGKMTPAARDAIIDDKAHAYSEAGELSISIEAFKAFAETIDKVIDSNETGSSNDNDSHEYSNAGEEVTAKAKKYAADNGVEFSAAMNAVLEADKDLAARYVNGE